jgi:hypothetical protein
LNLLGFSLSLYAAGSPFNLSGTPDPDIYFLCS